MSLRKGNTLISGAGLDGIDSVESIAPAYSTSSTYNVGDYVSYNGKLYVCTTEISTAEAWTPAHWSETYVMTVVGNINNALSNLVTIGGNE